MRYDQIIEAVLPIIEMCTQIYLVCTCGSIVIYNLFFFFRFLGLIDLLFFEATQGIILILHWLSLLAAHTIQGQIILGPFAVST